ncbi:hypothetical protein [Alkalicoccobacillus plakortidis]|uniref:DUF4064 domain-containing protein n=1 Tax=Alkalicoccobacillus plakortidis TaxID=444060 RepID=A0ABT0XNE9_9BACI|nr:hypothetical protein [Alkalicoccobacillus plakortidis]MCM2676858.1 hypothetical protein [Alkalicoccobacillus plakortidis]
MDTEKLGKRLGIGSIALMMLSMFLFYTQLIADAGLYTEIFLFGFLSIVGISLAIYSGKLTKRSKLFVIGVVGNWFMLIISGFLFVVMQIIES